MCEFAIPFIWGIAEKSNYKQNIKSGWPHGTTQGHVVEPKVRKSELKIQFCPLLAGRATLTESTNASGKSLCLIPNGSLLLLSLPLGLLGKLKTVWQSL